jgi:hypothetical protein
VLLVVLVVGIWALIIVRIFKVVSPPAPVEKVFPPSGKVQDVKEKKLLLNYRDPFLAFKSKEETLKKESAFPPVPQIEERPLFRFKGRISKGKKTMLMLEHQGETLMVGVKEEVQGFSISKVYEDSLIVTKGKKQYRILLE